MTAALAQLSEEANQARLSLTEALALAYPVGMKVAFRWQREQKFPSNGVVVGHHHGEVRIRYNGSDQVRQVTYNQIETEPRS